MEHSLRRAIIEIVLSTLFYALFCLVMMAIVAVFVRAYVPSAGVVTAVSWIVKCAGSFLMPLIFVRRGRALLKGAVAGISVRSSPCCSLRSSAAGFRLRRSILWNCLHADCSALWARLPEGGCVGSECRFSAVFRARCTLTAAACAEKRRAKIKITCKFFRAVV